MIYPGQLFNINKKEFVSDGKGGKVEKLVSTGLIVEGYLDLLTGTNRSFTNQNAVIEESTHVLVVPNYRSDIHDKMFLVDEDGRQYKITYVDNPVGVNHHLEIFLALEGDR